MASSKDVFENFSEFRGLDVRSSDLTRPQNAAQEIKNFIIEQNFSLGGEKGLKLFADALPAEPVAKIHNYIYQDQETGAEVEELVAIGKNLFRLKEGTFTINYSGSNAWGYDFSLDSSDEEFRIRLYDNGAVVLDYNVGTGVEDDSTGVINLSSVEAQIDGTANFTADSDATVDAIIAASFPLVSQYSIPSSTTSVDITVYYWEEVELPGTSAGFVLEPFAPYVQNHDDISIGLPSVINRNNCCYISCAGKTPLLKYDGVTVRQAGCPTVFPEDTALSAGTTGSALLGTFRYYIRFAKRDAQGNTIYGAGHKTDPITTTGVQAPRIDLFDNSSTTGFMASTQAVAIGGDTSTTGLSNTITCDNPLVDENLSKLYGHRPLAVGDIISIADAGGDFITRVVTAIDRSANQVTFSGAPATFLGTVAQLLWDNNYLLKYRFASANGTQAGASTITVNSGHTITAGDYVFFTASENWRKVLSTTSTTITIDGVEDVTNGDYFCDTIIEVWRTEDGGAEKFYLSQQISILDGVTVIYDTVADADLGEELILPAKEPDYLRNFPEVITQHQNVSIVAGGRIRPGRIWFEDFEFLEAFPLAVNFYDVPSQDAGLIKALWSDTYDQLAVLKSSAYYSVAGDFRAEIPVLNSIANTENDIGVDSQSSLIKIRGLNIGIGPLGFVAFQNGQIDYAFTKQLDSEFLSVNVGNSLPESEKLRTNRAVALNDRLKQQAYFLVPAFDVDSSGVHTGANENSKLYILDYSERTWSRRQLPSDLSSGSSGLVAFPMVPTAGMAIYQDNLFFGSCAYDSTHGNSDHTDFTSYLFRRKERDVLLTGETDYRQDYADGHVSIPYQYDTQWFFVDSLEDGLFHWLKIYSFSGTDFVPFDLRVRSYVDWDDTNVIDDVTLSFTSTTRFRLFKLQATRAQSLFLRFTTDTIFQKPTITGFQVVTGDVDGNLEGVR